MARACIVCGKPAVAGRSRCSKHGPTSPKGPSPYDAEHQKLAAQVLSQHPLICHICKQGPEAIPQLGPFQADHIVPLSLGGTTTLSNYAPAHRKCNVAKGGANRKKRI